jgi:hypothetical protein
MARREVVTDLQHPRENRASPRPAKRKGRREAGPNRNTPRSAGSTRVDAHRFRRFFDGLLTHAATCCVNALRQFGLTESVGRGVPARLAGRSRLSAPCRSGPSPSIARTGPAPQADVLYHRPMTRPPTPPPRRTWRVSIIRRLSHVEAPDKDPAVAAAIDQFGITADDRLRLVVEPAYRS